MYNFNLGGALVLLICVSAVIGWAAIEALLWVVAHVSISWG